MLTFASSYVNIWYKESDYDLCDLRSAGFSVVAKRMFKDINLSRSRVLIMLWCHFLIGQFVFNFGIYFCQFFSKSIFVLWRNNNYVKFSISQLNSVQ